MDKIVKIRRNIANKWKIYIYLENNFHVSKINISDRYFEIDTIELQNNIDIELEKPLQEKKNWTRKNNWTRKKHSWTRKNTIELEKKQLN